MRTSNPRPFKNRNKLTFHVKRDGSGTYRWELVSRNGKVICKSPDEGYPKISRCMAVVGLIMAEGAEAAIEHPEKKLEVERRLRASVLNFNREIGKD